MKRKRFISQKYFDKYKYLGQKKDIILKIKPDFQQKLLTLIGARKIDFISLGVIDCNI